MSLLDVISRVFPLKFLQIHITSVSGCLQFTYKTCQIVAGASMIRQFHEFSRFNFWRVFVIWNYCVRARTQLRKLYYYMCKLSKNCRRSHDTCDEVVVVIAHMYVQYKQ